MSIPERKDVNFADTWALTDLYGSDVEWRSAALQLAPAGG